MYTMYWSESRKTPPKPGTRSRDTGHRVLGYVLERLANGRFRGRGDWDAG